MFYAYSIQVGGGHWIPPPFSFLTITLRRPKTDIDVYKCLFYIKDIQPYKNIYFYDNDNVYDMYKMFDESYKKNTFGLW